MNNLLESWCENYTSEPEHLYSKLQNSEEHGVLSLRVLIKKGNGW